MTRCHAGELRFHCHALCPGLEARFPARRHRSSNHKYPITLTPLESCSPQTTVHQPAQGTGCRHPCFYHIESCAGCVSRRAGVPPANPVNRLLTSLVAQAVKASACNAGDWGSIPGSGRSPGEGNGNPLQHSCLENPRDGEASWASVYGVSLARILEWIAISFSRGSS